VSNLKEPVRIAVTGASGQIGYAALFRIASGEMLGYDQPVILLLELPVALKSLEGVVMELNDCAFPLVSGIVATDDVNKAFDGADFALLIGAKPRGKGMERSDLLRENAAIFSTQGKALNANANRDTLRVLVVGNPANTNALITSLTAPDIDPRRISAMTRLDHNRGLAQLSQKLNCGVEEIKQFCIWGNHSSTQYPDITNATLKGKLIRDLVDPKWVTDEFIPTVQKRGAAIIAARGSSSAASAANAAIMHVRDWVYGSLGEWTSMAVWADGNYGINDVYYSFPVLSEDGKYTVVPNVPIPPMSADLMTATLTELKEEKKEALKYL